MSDDANSYSEKTTFYLIKLIGRVLEVIDLTFIMLPFQSRLFARIISKGREVYLLKIISLAIGFACSTLIILFSLNEFGYDRFHDDAPDIFRVLQKNTSENYDRNRLSQKIPQDVTNQLRKVNSNSLICRINVLYEVNIGNEKKNNAHEKVHVTDPQILNIFSFDITDGSSDQFYKEARTAIISASTAQRYFGTGNASGKKIKVSFLQDTTVFTIAAVFADFPKNSHEDFGIFLRCDASLSPWLRFNQETGVYGKCPVRNLKNMESSVNARIRKNDRLYFLQSFTDIYFGPRVFGEDSRHGDQYSIIILICIAGLMLFLSLTSFINLTTLTLPNRSKELAVKKLAGASQFELVSMFAKESFTITGVSLAIGIGMLIASSHWIDSLLSINPTQLLLRADPTLIITMMSLIFVIGSTPLFMTLKFTRATPTRLLGTETITFPRFKRVITFLQLGISIFLIVSSLVVQRQVNRSLIKEPGQNHEQIVYVDYPEGMTNDDLRRLRIAWKKYHANIVDVIAVSQLPDRINSKELNSDFYFISVDPVFRDFFGLKMEEGNWFKANDGDSIFTVTPVGKSILSSKEKNVIGVVEDLSSQFNLPQKPVKVFNADFSQYNYLCVKILEVDIRRTMEYLSNYFKEGDTPANIAYFNKRFEEWILYQDRLNNLSEVIAIISILLSCCAIYGLSISLVRDKIKQIAIHKLHGATLVNITALLVREFTRQMLIAIVVFGPFTYIFLKEWLRNFVYSTHFTWTDPFYPLAYCTLVIISLCGFQALSLNRSDLTSALKS